MDPFRFPLNVLVCFTDNHETVGEKLLKTYNVMRYLSLTLCVNMCLDVKGFDCFLHVLILFLDSYIAIVPPTPPAYTGFDFEGRSGVKYMPSGVECKCKLYVWVSRTLCV